MPAPQASASLLPGGEGRHYAQIKAAIPESLISASPALRAAITQAKPEIPAWYAATTPAQKAALQNLLEASIKSHTALEQATGKVQEVNAFARPLLEAALKNAGFELDVNQVHLRLYVPVEGLATGYRTKTLSLLQAALNNFEARDPRRVLRQCFRLYHRPRRGWPFRAPYHDPDDRGLRPVMPRPGPGQAVPGTPHHLPAARANRVQEPAA
ncbi:hypothetical protein P0D90_24680 [Pseudomonas sp. CBSPCBW29]|nr:hypothetical protein P0D90_24680 [Pseudomonas sp. CBSPCBW29]